MLLAVLLFSAFSEGAVVHRCTNSQLPCLSGSTCQSCTPTSSLRCSLNSNCSQGQSCQISFVNGRVGRSCVHRRPPHRGTNEATEHYCPGGGAVVVGFDGKLATCDLLNQCRGDQICNPQLGVCCTKIRTCPRPSRTMLNAITRKPILCQIRFGRVMPCPSGGYCETKTGFCCLPGNTVVTTTPPVRTRPWLGQACNVRDGCEGGAACMCDTRGKCKCDCPAELGYGKSTDGKTCQRVRRRLKEKCKTDMECSAAFSECSTGGCRCKKGFQRDGKGGCKPISYNCINNGKPLMISDEIVMCSMKTALAKLVFSSMKHNTTNATDLAALNATADWPASGRDDCPEGHYCVPLFDDASKPGYYQGFCCPSPGETRPVCPVGEPHETSFPPDYGCLDCPVEYYCHRDAYYREKSICCAKPCISLEDIYHDGQCYPTAFYGDSCHISAQCSPSRNSTDEFSENSPLECVKGVCACRAGFSHIDGECKRVMCTIGLRGEPSVDRNNQLIRCGRSSDCSQGQMCDPNTRVCCKGVNRCPKDYVETGETCENELCKRHGDLCHRPKSGKVKICCTEDGA
ncbi:hypothetical protein Y032_0063g3422 [Ancylostoma ceylanicum]|uniref:EB domain-containing protein n=1 Tax=Ancylostoma ceylanicum TaxID=53326 RepID=A0A016U1B8_9BILA|nr:hypothetical protein Y032_0063g3422 [Ancylostoma ceylanicum]